MICSHAKNRVEMCATFKWRGPKEEFGWLQGGALTNFPLTFLVVFKEDAG